MTTSRVCYVTTEWGGVTRGGIGQAVRARVEDDPARALVLLDSSARVANRVGRTAPAGVVIERVALRADAGPPPHAFRSRAYFTSYRIWRALVALVAEHDIERVEFPDFDGPAFVSVKARRLALGPPLPPLSIRLHGSVERVARADGRALLSLGDKQRVAMERYALRYADEVVAPSRAVLDEVAAETPLAAARRTEAPRVDVPRIEITSPAARSPLVVGFLGKLQPLKGPATLVEAAVALLDRHGPDAIELHLVGGDEAGRFAASHEAELRRLVPPELAPRFRFHGALAREVALRRIARCHAAVLPSRSETFGLAAREIEGMGLPLAVSDLPAFRDLGRGAATVERFSRDDVAALTAILDRWREELAAGRWPPGAAADDREGALATSGAAWAESGASSDDPALVAAGTSSDDRTLVAAGTSSDDRTLVATGSPPLVSIVVPFHEMQAHVDACLDSITADPYPRKEIVLVDDGTTSAAGRAKLAELEERAGAGREAGDDVALRIVRKRNGGLASARNAGVRVARGEYVLPLDPDDLIVAGYLEAAVRALEAAPDLCWVNGLSGRFVDGTDPTRVSDWIVPYDPDASMLYYENGAGTAAAVFRRSTLLAWPYDETLPAYEDWDLQLRLARAGLRGEGLPRLFHRYRARRQGLAAQAHARHAELVSRLLAPHLREIDPDARRALEIYLSSSAAMRGLDADGHGLLGGLGLRSGEWYRRHAKDVLGELLGEARRDRFAHAVRRALRRLSTFGREGQ